MGRFVWISFFKTDMKQKIPEMLNTSDVFAGFCFVDWQLSLKNGKTLLFKRDY